MLNNLKRNRDGQIGETMTWIVATLVIVVILGISIFIASISASGLKRLNQDFFQTSDVLASKSMFSYVLTKDVQGNNVYSQLKTEGVMNNFNGGLALDIFRGLYRDDYSLVWLGFVDNRPGLVGLSASNVYFGEGTRGVKEKYEPLEVARETIKISIDSSLEFRLFPK